MYRLAVLVAAAALALSACASDDSSSGGDDSSGPDTDSDALTVDDAWARTTPEGAERTAVYLTIESAETDELVSVSVPADVAATAELHETVADAGDEGMDDGDMDDDEGMDHERAGDGVTSMRAVDVIPVEAGTTTLEPGGYHVMLMELAAPVAEGDSFELTLDFEKAGTYTVVVAARTG